MDNGQADDMFKLLELIDASGKDIDKAWRNATRPIIEQKERERLDEKRLAELERQSGCNDV